MFELISNIFSWAPIAQLEGITPLSHRNIPKIRKVLNTIT